MKHRKLRIAWSVACGLSCLLLTWLWVCSYSTNQVVGVRIAKTGFAAQYAAGRFVLTKAANVVSFSQPIANSTDWAKGMRQHENGLGFWKYSDKWGADLSLIQFPCWWPITALAISSVVVLLPFRFSLLGLMLVTTALAVGLGLIVWALK